MEVYLRCTKNRTRSQFFVRFGTGSRCKWEDIRGPKGQAEFVNSVLFKNWKTMSTLSSLHERISKTQE
jgi:hypothetical protein